jgi:hypothetical protein
MISHRYQPSNRSTYNTIVGYDRSSELPARDELQGPGLLVLVPVRRGLSSTAVNLEGQHRRQSSSESANGYGEAKHLTATPYCLTY